MKRWVIVDLFTNEVEAAQEAHGDHGSFEELRSVVEADPRKMVLELSDYDRLTPSLALMAEERALRADEITVGLPLLGTVEFEPASGWLVGRARPDWETARGRTMAERVADLVADGVAANVAPILARAERDEYAAYDPLEHVYPAGATPAEIFDSTRARKRVQVARQERLRRDLEAAGAST